MIHFKGSFSIKQHTDTGHILIGTFVGKTAIKKFHTRRIPPKRVATHINLKVAHGAVWIVWCAGCAFPGPNVEARHLKLNGMKMHLNHCNAFSIILTVNGPSCLRGLREWPVL